MSHTDELFMEEALRRPQRAQALEKCRSARSSCEMAASWDADAIGRSPFTIRRPMRKCRLCGKRAVVGNYRLMTANCMSRLNLAPCAPARLRTRESGG